MAQPLDPINCLAHRVDRAAQLQCPHAHRAVHRHHPLRGRQHLVEVAGAEVVDPPRRTPRPRHRTHPSPPVLHAGVQRMHLHQQMPIRRRGTQKAVDGLGDGRVHVRKVAVFADRIIRLHLHGEYPARPGWEPGQRRRRRPRLRAPPPQRQPGAEIRRHRMMQLKTPKVPEPPRQHIGQVETHVPYRLLPEIIGEAPLPIHRRQSERQFADRIGVARKPAVAIHPVPLQHDPVRPDVAEIGDGHGHPGGVRGGDGNLVVRPLLAQQHQVGHAVPGQERRDEAWPFFRRRLEIGGRVRPEQRVAAAHIDPVDRMTTAMKELSQPVKVRGDRALQEKEALMRCHVHDRRRILRRGRERTHHPPAGANRDARQSAARTIGTFVRRSAAASGKGQ